LIVFDLADVAEASVRRISMTSWFRLRRAAEETGTALITLTATPQIPLLFHGVCRTQAHEIAAAWKAVARLGITARDSQAYRTEKRLARLAARLAARFVATERNERVGDTVGYQVRPEPPPA